jgi:hypothetical protein
LAVRGRNSSGGFFVYELVIPGRITIYPVEGEGWQFADEKSSVRMATSPGFLIWKDLYRVSIIFKNSIMKTSLKLKIKLIRPYYDLQIYPMK